MRIINAHCHLGHDYVFDEEETEEHLLEWHDKYNINTAIVQPFVSRPYIEDMQSYHDRINALCLKYPGKFYGMASINPHIRPEEYYKEAVRCIKELNFVGIKITPIAHAVNPASKDGLYVFEVATELKTPVMVHTGSGAPFSDPVILISVAESFREIPIVLAHGGTDLLFAQALYLAEKFDNVYLEPSWLNVLNLRKALGRVGAKKIMFSSDHCINIPVELAKYKVLLEGKPELEQALGLTAAMVFGLDKR